MDNTTTAIFLLSGNSDTDKNEVFRRLINEVKENYVKMNSYSKLLDTAKNKVAIDVISEKYVKADNNWTGKINELGAFIFQGSGLDKLFNISVNFDKFTADIMFEEKMLQDECSALYEHLKSNGWEFRNHRDRA